MSRSFPASPANHNWLSRWQQRLRPAPHPQTRLGYRSIFILPTWRGAAWLLCLLVMLVGAINYNLSLGHALVFLLAGIGLADMVLTFRNLAGLELHTQPAPFVFQGEAALFPLTLSSKRREARHGLRFAFAGQPCLRFRLLAGDSARVAPTIMSEHRGWLRPGRLTISCRYPLGLFVAWSYFTPDRPVLVIPKPLDRPVPEQTTGHTPGQRPLPGGDDFHGLRPHQMSDSPRHVAWKLLARGAPMMTKQFAGEGGETLTLDFMLAEGDNETRLRILCGWALTLSRQDRPYALQLPGTHIAEGRGEAHLARCLRAIALHDLPREIGHT